MSTLPKPPAIPISKKPTTPTKLPCPTLLNYILGKSPGSTYIIRPHKRTTTTTTPTAPRAATTKPSPPRPAPPTTTTTTAAAPDFTPSQDTTLLRLKDTDSKTWNEIAQALGKSKNRVSQRYRELTGAAKGPATTDPTQQTAAQKGGVPAQATLAGQRGGGGGGSGREDVVELLADDVFSVAEVSLAPRAYTPAGGGD